MGDRRTLLKAAVPAGLAALTGLATLTAACAPLDSLQSLLKPDDREHLTVLADASLAPTVPSLKGDFERANPHALLSISLLSSGAIMKTVLRGKDFDAVLLGGDTFGVPIVEAGLIKIGTMRPFTSNWLVIATAADSPLKIQTARDLFHENVERIGIADWELSALGIYSQQALDNLGLWESLRSTLVKSRDEREVGERLIDGKVDAALLYSSSASTAEEGIRIQAPIPEQAHRPIIYYVGTAQESKYPITIAQFSKYLVSQWGQRHFESAGYRMLNLS